MHDIQTAIRWLASQGATVSMQDLTYLRTILKAEVNYIQGVCAGLLVKSTFDTDTALVYKVLERNWFSFRGESLEHLRNAAEISAARSRTTPAPRERDGFQT